MFIAVTHTEAGLAITTVLMSFGITYGLHLITSIIMAAICSPFLDFQVDGTFYLQLLASMVTFLFMYLLFKVKRLRKGMPFLRNSGAQIISSVLGFIVLICMILVDGRDDRTYLNFFPTLIIFIISIFILIWWRSRITKAYIEMLKGSERKALEEALKESSAQLEALKKDNDALSALVHKDNKLIPALVLSVQELLSSAGNASVEELRARGSSLLERLDKTARERDGILNRTEATPRLPKTGVDSADEMLMFLSNRAQNDGVKLDVAISGDIADKLSSMEGDFTTLLADLTENAVIAAKQKSGGKVLVSLSVISKHLLLSIFDSGAPFDDEVLLSLGRERITTHALDGGSGIGLMTTTEIAHKYGASFAIEEIDGQTGINSGFCKRVSVIFDRRSKYILRTSRNAELKRKAMRSDILYI